jgi:nucleoside-diphosphate-sugar epimerase
MTSPLIEEEGEGETKVPSSYRETGYNGKCTYISDAVEGTYLVAEKGEGQAAPYNICTNVETSLMDLAKLE